MVPRHSIFMLLALCVAIGGCARKLRDANLACVKQDMSPKEVESILGQPARVKTHELVLQTEMKTLPAERYYYDQNGKTVELVFVNGKLVGQDGSFGK